MVQCVDAPLDLAIAWLHARAPGLGLHDLLLYETPKVTRIRDAKLGLLYYFFVIGIIFYLCTQYGSELEFLAFVEPSVTSSFALFTPTRKPCKLGDSFKNGCVMDFHDTRELDYCCHEGCTYPDLSDPDVCQCPGTEHILAVSCRRIDAVDAGDVQPNTVFLKTYVETWRQEINPECILHEGGCGKLWLNVGTAGIDSSLQGEVQAGSKELPIAEFADKEATKASGKANRRKLVVDQGTPYEEVNRVFWDGASVMYPWKYNHSSGAKLTVLAQPDPSKRFTADAGGFVLAVTHSVHAQELGIKAQMSEMQGTLRVGSNHGNPKEMQHRLCRERDDAVDSPYRGKPTNEAPCYISPHRVEEGDTITFKDLLASVGICLDDDEDGDTIPLRGEGVSLEFEIVHFNTWPWVGPLADIHYYYKVVGPLKEARHEEAQYTATGQNSALVNDARSVEISKGIFMTISPSGRIGAFSIHSFLTTLASGLALFGVTTIIVTFIARFMMRWSEYYSEMIFDTSEDLGDLQHISAMEVEVLDLLLSKRNLITTGTKDERVLRLLADGWKIPQIGDEDDEHAPLLTRLTESRKTDSSVVDHDPDLDGDKSQNESQ